MTCKKFGPKRRDHHRSDYLQFFSFLLGFAYSLHGEMPLRLRKLQNLVFPLPSFFCVPQDTHPRSGAFRGIAFIGTWFSLILAPETHFPPLEADPPSGGFFMTGALGGLFFSTYTNTVVFSLTATFPFYYIVGLLADQTSPVSSRFNFLRTGGNRSGWKKASFSFFSGLALFPPLVMFPLRPPFPLIPVSL